LNSFQETPNGDLLVASGFDPVMRWDGQSSQMYLAGIVAPTVAPVIAGSGSGGIKGTYFGFVRFIDNNGYVSNLSPISNTLTVNGVTSIIWTNVATSNDPKVVRRQLLRNTAGQAQTFFVDLDTDDVTSTTLTTSNVDLILGAQEAVPLLAPDGSLFANTHDPPPNHKISMAHVLGRMFYLAETDYVQGAAKCATGAQTIKGVGTEWTTSMVNRVFYPTSGRFNYTITAVDTVNQVLTLDRPYQDPSDLFCVYAIRPQKAERKLIYYSEAGQPESVPLTNALSIQEDGDELTGGMVKGSFVYFNERRHIYRFTFQSDPAKDGFVFLASNRGCVNHRCWVVVEDVAYMLDEQGIHAFGGGQDDEPISTVVQDLFRYSEAKERINWQASRFFHCVHFPQQEVIRWFVCMSGTYLPRHSIGLNYRTRRWFLERWPVAIGASCTGLLAGQPQVYLGSDNRRVLALWQGSTDGPDPATGTVQGTVATATNDSITDINASFPAKAVVNNPVSIVAGTGVGQDNIVRVVSGTTFKVLSPWAIEPDITSVYQLGGVRWTWQSGWYRFSIDEQLEERRLSMTFRTVVAPSTMIAKVYYDFSATPIVWKETMTVSDGNGVGSVEGSADLTIDCTKYNGFVQKRIPGHKETYIDGPRYVSVSLAGVTNSEFQKVFVVVVDAAGAPQR
jgi:hypothetical protein